MILFEGRNGPSQSDESVRLSFCDDDRVSLEMKICRFRVYCRPKLDSDVFNSRRQCAQSFLNVSLDLYEHV